MSSRGPSLRRPAGHDALRRLDAQLDRRAAGAHGPEVWISAMRKALAARSPEAFDIAEQGLRAFPADPELLLIAALTALATAASDRALVLLKRYSKRYGSGKPAILLTCLAWAQQGQFTRAWTTLQDEGLNTGRTAIPWFVGDDIMEHWLYAQLHEIRREQGRPQGQAQTRPAKPPGSDAGAPPILGRRPAQPRPDPSAAPRPPLTRGRRIAPVVPERPATPDLPRLEAQFDVTFELANADAIEISGPDARSDAHLDLTPFRLRAELVRLSLFEGFDELLCLPALQGVEAHWSAWCMDRHWSSGRLLNDLSCLALPSVRRR